MKDGNYLATAHSEEEKDRLLRVYERALKKTKAPGRIVAEHRRVKYTHQWDLYHVVD